MRKLIDGEWVTAEEIYEKHKRMVYHIARKFARYAPFDDLSSEGMIGLLKAYDNYDEGKGYKFLTYATQAIHSHVIRFYNSWSIGAHYPHHIRELSVTIRRRNKELDKTPEQLAQEIGTTVSRVQAALKYLDSRKPISMDMEVHNDENTTLANIFPAAPDDTTRVHVDEFIKGLAEIPRIVLLGLLEEKTFAVIADENDWTKSVIENAKDTLQANLFFYRQGRPIGTFRDIPMEEVAESGYFEMLPQKTREVVALTVAGLPLEARRKKLGMTANQITHHLRKARLGYAKWSVLHETSIG